MTADRAAGRAPEPARYFDDLKPGEHFVTGEWALNEAEIVAFARQFDPQPIHVDVAGAAHGPYGGLIASGFQTMALGFRLFYELGVINEACIGGPGIDAVRFHRPARPGDSHPRGRHRRRDPPLALQAGPRLCAHRLRRPQPAGRAGAELRDRSHPHAQAAEHARGNAGALTQVRPCAAIVRAGREKRSTP